MKKVKSAFLMILCILCIGMCTPQMTDQVNAANLGEMLSAKKAPAGKWVKNKKGYRYRYYGNKYARNTWMRIKTKVYYFNSKGYRVTGIKKYKENLYYLNKNGVLCTGWKRVGNDTYFFSKVSGAAFYGWHTIDGQSYYFDQRGVMLKNSWVGEYYVDESGYMMKNVRVGDYYLGADGRRVSLDTSISLEDQSPIIFVGDSRTVGLGNTVGGDYEYIGKVGEGYQWFITSGVKILDAHLKVFPESKVVINLGINDMGNLEKYISYYRMLLLNYPQTKFYFMSVNPIETKLAKAYGYNTVSVNNERIQAFNSRLKAEFPAAYLDCYNYLVSQNLVKNVAEGRGTVDGIHYTSNVYRNIHDFAVSKIN